MQNDAVRRVEQMQKKARKTAGIDDRNSQTAIESQSKNNSFTAPQTLKPAQSDGKTEATFDNAVALNEKIGSVFGKISADKDKALILPLVLLLSEEHADEMLILSLLYILS